MALLSQYHNMTRLGVADILGMIALALSVAMLWLIAAAPQEGVIHTSVAYFDTGNAPGAIATICLSAAVFVFNYHATLTKQQRDEQLASAQFRQVAAVLIDEVGIDAPFGFLRQQRRLVLYTIAMFFMCGSLSLLALLLRGNGYLASIVVSLLVGCMFLFLACLAVSYRAHAQVTEMAIMKVTQDAGVPR